MQDATPGLGEKRQILRGLSGAALLALYLAIALAPLLLALVAGKPARNAWRELSAGLSEPPSGWRGPVGELPPPMMNSVERSLLSFGVPGRQIIAERFKYD